MTQKRSFQGLKFPLLVFSLLSFTNHSWSTKNSELSTSNTNKQEPKHKLTKVIKALKCT